MSTYVRQTDKVELTVHGQGFTLDEMLQDAEKNADIGDDGWLLYDLTSDGVTVNNCATPHEFFGTFTATYRRKVDA